MTPSRADHASTLVFAALLATIMVLPRMTTGLFIVAGLAGIAAVRWRAHPSRFVHEAARGWPQLAGFAWPALAYLGLTLLQYGFGMAESSVVERTVLALGAMAWALSGSPVRAGDIRDRLLPAAAAGALLGAVYAAVQVFVVGAERAYGALGVGPIGNGAIKFGDLAVVLSLLSLVLAIDARVRRERVIGCVGLAGGIAIVVLSGSRGALIGFALAAAALGWAYGRQRGRAGEASRVGPATGGGAASAASPAATSLAPRLVGMAVVLMLAAATLVMSPRFVEIGEQIERYEQGDAISPTGQRLALWGAALRSVQHAPLFGVGVNRFDVEIRRQVAAGDIPPTVKILHRHVHNEYLCAWATLGLGGLVSLSAMFVMPIVVAARRIARGCQTPASHAGLALAIAFAAFALTDCLFDRQLTFVFFFLMTTWLMRVGGEDARAAGPAKAFR